MGAGLVIQDFLSDRTLAAHLPCMPYCAVWFADDQIREQATLAGNIVNASPPCRGNHLMSTEPNAWRIDAHDSVIIDLLNL